MTFYLYSGARPDMREMDMKKMRRLLAALLVTTMLFGSNGFSYAAEAVGGDLQEEAQKRQYRKSRLQKSQSPKQSRILLLKKQLSKILLFRKQPDLKTVKKKPRKKLPRQNLLQKKLLRKKRLQKKLLRKERL